MQPRDRVSLQDIVEQINTIQEYLVGQELEDFLQDTMRQDAVIRRFELIGEAATRLSDEFRTSHPEITWRTIRDMRNFLIHVYDSVDITIVWTTAHNDITPLLRAVEKMLGEEPS
ncbi:MAG: DUF86 domain-containing protein [bacterium]